MEHEKHHIVSYTSHLWIWVILLVFTVITVGVAEIDLQKLTVVVALAVATVKAVIVGAYFMHLKFDNKMLTIMASLVLLIFTVFLTITLIDYALR